MLCAINGISPEKVVEEISSLMEITKFTRFIKRYWVVTLFPGFTITAISADLWRTHQWKKRLAAEEQFNVNN
ncbi:hypothetical protein E2986_12122 [Frieseomelitta varia]|uniref:Uncharacterized protein n=1 Tax=Frieseomelitta varia TaxID=561572 RepID=A0A833RME2_9HYME|nr:uncharacterized protein LOC122535906 [Frieseomelitta varia]KAF3422048.1 hypothetical protein E2986_12122 [Frieseomelitta varia]